jgi:hypothetical protein
LSIQETRSLIDLFDWARWASVDTTRPQAPTWKK